LDSACLNYIGTDTLVPAIELAEFCVRDADLKFQMVIELGKMEDSMKVFLPGSVHK
jgi:hypothetical protein